MGVGFVFGGEVGEGGDGVELYEFDIAVRRDAEDCCHNGNEVLGFDGLFF